MSSNSSLAQIKVALALLLPLSLRPALRHSRSLRLTPSRPVRDNFIPAVE